MIGMSSALSRGSSSETAPLWEDVSGNTTSSSLPSPPRAALSQGRDEARGSSGIPFPAAEVEIKESVGPSPPVGPDLRGGSSLYGSPSSARETGEGPETLPVHVPLPGQGVTVENYKVHPSEYSDRSRLLYHITHLATQWQRTQLQLQEQHRAVVILQQHVAALRNTSNATLESGEQKENERCLSVSIPCSGFTAAVLAAQEETAVQKHLESRQYLFDPLLAQTQIHRLDDALAHLSLLREAEMSRAQKAEDELERWRESHHRLSEEADQLSSQLDTLQSKSAAQERQLAQYTLEVERLRLEEIRLNRQVAELQRFTNNTMGPDSAATGHDGTRLTPAAVSPSFASSLLRVFDEKVEKLLEEEAAARQTLWITMFWEPMAMALDAGLTWLSEVEKEIREKELAQLRRTLEEEAETRRSSYPPPVHEALTAMDSFQSLWSGNRSAPDAGVIATLSGSSSNPTDADLLLLHHQQKELLDIRSQWELTQQRLRASEVEVERFKTLYYNEKKQGKQVEQDHLEQLKRVYTEVMKDREIVESTLKRDVEQQVRQAFSEGRRYERQLLKERPSKKPSTS